MIALRARIDETGNHDSTAAEPIYWFPHVNYRNRFTQAEPRVVGSDIPFWTCLALLSSVYVLLIAGMFLAKASFTSPDHIIASLGSAEIQYAIKLSLISCTISTILSLWVAVPIGYLMSRWDDSPIRRFISRISRALNRIARRFHPSQWRAVLVVCSIGLLLVGTPIALDVIPSIAWSVALWWLVATVLICPELFLLSPLYIASGLVRLLNPKLWLDAILDIPIVLPPLVLGLALLILFQTPIARWFEDNFFAVTFSVPSVILAQFAVACAFAVRTMRVTFDQISPRTEAVALTLGCTRAQAFWRVVLPESKRGILTAGTLAWARSLGEFGPILVFSGATRMRTEVLPTSVFLELSIGNIEAAVAVSLLMIVAAVLVLIILRMAGSESLLEHQHRL